MNNPPKGQIHNWTDARGSAGTFKLAQLARSNQCLYVLVADDAERAREMQEELSFYGPETQIAVFPDRETLPYDNFSPQSEIIAERLTTLHTLPNLSKGIVVVPVQTLMQRIPPLDYILSRVFRISKSDAFDIQSKREFLSEAGYRRVDTVYEHGEFAYRGSIFDVFPVGSDHPIRIDLFDDEIESLRIFDPDTQRTINETDSIEILPAHEYPLDSESITKFRVAWNNEFEASDRECMSYQDISEGRPSEGVEYYLPLFFDHTNSFFDFLDDDSVVVLDTNVSDHAQKFYEEVHDRFESHRFDPSRPLLRPSKLYFSPDELRHEWKDFSKIQLLPDSPEVRHSVSLNSSELPNISVEPRRGHAATRRLRDFVTNVDARVLVTSESQGRQQHLLDILRRDHLFPTEVSTFSEFLFGEQPLSISVAPITRGLWLDDIVVLTETQILGVRSESERERARRRSIDPDTIIRNLTELHPGAPVVHIDHGVGRYVGLQTLRVKNQTMEFVTLEYADGDKLYVPVSSLNLISRYTGADDEHAPLHKLGADTWSKAKRQAARRIFDVAAELLNIYARRKAGRSVVFPQTDDEFELFCDQCDFDLTSDQEQATESILDDLGQDYPTDRVVCGDVGFGKTEVAMRAAFHVVQSGHQVVILVPTTILAQQHFDTFSDRFSMWPHNISLMSRFRTSAEVTETLQKVSEGTVDILIGTHKILHANIEFKNLGLLIVDEEHRFGVRDKERIKNLKAEVDTISLTATPIPRTLNMSMGGLRDLSIIATPPARRLSVKTFVVQYNTVVVRDAIQRELARGGQVFYLHNVVQSIQNVAESLAKVVPEARIGVGHGRMRKTELERVMSDFYHRRCNLLICTTIIESGLDIPNANTIIIDRADQLGLAQLHQLRGRVGRSHRQAYAYLMTPPEEVLSIDAKKRLDAIESSGDLGSGFTLAIHDLEIRGAGELLGQEQSGQLETIGFSLYMQMLNRTVETLKRGLVPNFEDPMPMTHEINLHTSALIPADFLPDIHTRLVTYKRIAAVKTRFELDELQVELIDRCGPLPEEAKNLFRVTAIKLTAQELGVGSVSVGEDGGRIEFLDKNEVNSVALVSLLQSQPNTFQLTQNQNIRISRVLKEEDERFTFVEEIFEKLRMPEPVSMSA